VKSLTRPAFWQLYRALPEDVRELARKNHRLFMANPDHPGLNFKKLRGAGNFWSVRVGRDYRVVGQRDGDAITWLWIGPHAEYDRLF